MTVFKDPPILIKVPYALDHPTDLEGRCCIGGVNIQGMVFIRVMGSHSCLVKFSFKTALKSRATTIDTSRLLRGFDI